MGAAARHGGRLRGSADLRIAQLDHVLGKSCYFFVRPKKSFLEVCVFLGRTVKSPHVRRVDRASKSKVAHVIQVRHRDEVEAPITDWLQEAYEYSGAVAATGAPARVARKTKTARKSARAKAKTTKRR